MSKWTSWFRMTPPAKPAMVSVAPVERQPTYAGGKFQPLHKYLEDRYATIVVLKVSEIEDILGFALPVQARTDRAWWTVADPNTPTGPYADAWKSAGRTAVPNLLAHTVVFERMSQSPVK
jgi:hypothetical protein